MRIIAHRGKFAWHERPEDENNPEIFLNILSGGGFAVEVDVQSVNTVNGNFEFGHDKTVHESMLLDIIKPNISMRDFFFHAKNQKALQELLDLKANTGRDFDIFYHDSDEMTLTHNGLIWLYPTPYPKATPRSIMLFPERYDSIALDGYYGICTDQPIEMRKKLKEVYRKTV